MTSFFTFLHIQSNGSVNLSVKDNFNAAKSRINIGVITSWTPTSEVRKSIEEALQYARKVMNYNNVEVKLLELHNYTSNLDCSLVRFCDKISSENITSVIIIDRLLGSNEKFNFIPWISSQLGISLTLVHESVPLLNEQVKQRFHFFIFYFLCFVWFE